LLDFGTNGQVVVPFNPGYDCTFACKNTRTHQHFETVQVSVLTFSTVLEQSIFRQTALIGLLLAQMV